MNRKNLLKLSLITLIIGLLVLAIEYFFFHFVTDEGITTVWQPEPGKPFVSNMIGVLAVLFIFASIICLFISFIFFDKNKNK